MSKRVAEELEETVHQGVYAMVGGPHLETGAEINMLRVLGADLVGEMLLGDSVTNQSGQYSLFLY